MMGREAERCAMQTFRKPASYGEVIERVRRALRLHKFTWRYKYLYINRRRRAEEGLQSLYVKLAIRTRICRIILHSRGWRYLIVRFRSDKVDSIYTLP